MQRIDCLTNEQYDSLEAFQKTWRAVATCTARADRSRAEAAILGLRAAIGYHEHPTFVWGASPAACLLAIAILKSPEWSAFVAARSGESDALELSSADNGQAPCFFPEFAQSSALAPALRISFLSMLQSSHRGSLKTTLGDSLRPALASGLIKPMRASLRSSLKADFKGTLQNYLVNVMRSELVPSLRQVLESSLSTSQEHSFAPTEHDPWGGQLDADWIALYQFCREELSVFFEPKRLRQFDLWRDLALSCGMWWCYDNYVILSERPTAVATELAPAPSRSGQRVHSATSPAVAFSDGWQIFAWHGVGVPPEIILAPERVDPARVIAERNMEVRRAMTERVGMQRLLVGLNARAIHRDSYGILYHLDVPGSESIRAVVVQCPSTLRQYWLRVPPEIWRAQQAVAWTFGLRERDYAPDQET